MLNRFVIPTIEGRIFTGITMFVAVMILIGWVAINEPARMASFVEQHNGRSIERGAELFASRCSTCHGADARGIVEKAPGLNNPMLFGHSFFKDINDQIAPLERKTGELNAQLEELNNERTALTTEAGSADLTDARRQEINTRLAEIDALTDVEGDTAIPPQLTAIQAELQPLYTQRDALIDSLQGPIDKGYLPELEAARTAGGAVLTAYLNQDSSRLAQVGWGGSVDNYIRTTLIHGRPGSEKVWPAPMVSWSQRGTGPLRDDQLDDIVAYIMNYDKGDAWTTEDLASVQQFAKLHGGGGGAGSDIPPVGTDVETAFTTVEPLVGDPVRGEALYTGGTRTELKRALGCAGCHLGGVSAPPTEGTWERVETVRLLEPQFAGYTPEHYVIESIINPAAYIVPTYTDAMPHNFGEILSPKDLADIVAFLYSTSPNFVAPDPETITPLTAPGGAAAPAAQGTAEAPDLNPAENSRPLPTEEAPSGEGQPVQASTVIPESTPETTPAGMTEVPVEGTPHQEPAFTLTPAGS
jgi:mono/diheme cytochrome c family protein